MTSRSVHDGGRPPASYKAHWGPLLPAPDVALAAACEPSEGHTCLGPCAITTQPTRLNGPSEEGERACPTCPTVGLCVCTPQGKRISTA